MSAIEIVDYDERWPAEFAQLRDRLLAALAPLEVRVEHVGSTAVPGLAAKPKIDVNSRCRTLLTHGAGHCLERLKNVPQFAAGEGST